MNTKKGYGSVDVRLPEQLSLIEKLNQSQPKRYPVKLLCEVFDVHSSTYKYWLVRDNDICPEHVRLVSEIR